MMSKPMTTTYSIKQFQAISEVLLKKYFGLDLNDTRLCEEDYVKVLTNSGSEPFEYINKIAEDFSFDRVDGGFSSTINQADQDKVVASLRHAQRDNCPSP
jgi:hypothetical protein